MRRELRVETGGREHVLGFDSEDELEERASRLGLRPVAFYRVAGGPVVHWYGEPDGGPMGSDGRERRPGAPR